MASAPMTVVETGEFLKRAEPLLSDSERAELVAFVGANPDAGEVIPESGGVRKIRWALQGRGKRGGSAYAKNRKASLSKAERNAMKRLVPALVAGYARKG